MLLSILDKGKSRLEQAVVETTAASSNKSPNLNEIFTIPNSPSFKEMQMKDLRNATRIE